MSTAALDRLLALLVAAMAVTGLLTLRAGAPAQGWVFIAHGILGGALLVAAVVKLRRAVPPAIRKPHPERLVVAAALTAGTLLALLGGFGWVASGGLPSLGGTTLLTLHAIIGLALLPLVAVHLAPRRWRLLRPGRASLSRGLRRVSRRSFLAAGTLLAAAVAVWGGAAAVERIRGGERRFTGSRWLPAGGIPPVTTFFGEGTPEIDPAAWRLTISGRVARAASYDLDDIARLGEEELTAVLDCTGGWAMETTWRGVPMARLLADAGADPAAARVEVRSVTGWGAAFGLAEAEATFLATEVAGERLLAGNGAPCRLVVPDRRGLDWVKWVESVVVA